MTEPNQPRPNQLRADQPSPDGPIPDQAMWDERYAESDRIWSGQPNGALVSEVSDLAPGSALDVGCGEGADAVWLARSGWSVTALDVSAIALQRARSHAVEVGAQVRWLHAGLVDAPLQNETFDLVSAQYPALLRTPDHQAERALLAAVAPHGVLLVVHHDYSNAAHAKPHGFDPQDYVSPPDVAALLDTGWRIELDETRERILTSGAGAGHSHDVVLRARRLQ